MLRFIQSSDWHLTQGKLFDETLRCLEFIAEVGEREKVDAYLLPGDFTHSDLPHRVQVPVERNALLSLFNRMSGNPEYGDPFTHLTYGNHDIPGDLQCFHERGRVAVDDGARLTRWSGADVLVVPYPHKRHWLARREAGAVEQQRQEVGHALGTALRGLVQQRRPGVPLIGLAHLNIAGSKVGGGEVMIGQEIELSPADLDEIGCDYWALGHIHQAQQVASRAWYAGTPQPHSFGDSNDNVALLVEIEAGAEPRVTRIELPSVKLYTLPVVWLNGMWNHTAEPPASKAHAHWRVVATVDEADRERADWEHLIAGMPPGTRIERRIIPTTRVRSEAIRAAHTPAEKLAAYFATLTPEPSVADREAADEALMEVADG